MLRMIYTSVGEPICKLATWLDVNGQLFKVLTTISFLLSERNS